MLYRIFFLLLPLFSLSANDFNFLQEALKKLIEQFTGSEETLADQLVHTSHTIELPSGPLKYSAITGLLPQCTDEGEPVGQLFFTAYLKEDDTSNRPITFMFNGGPGGSSLALHIGGLGPRRILFPEEGLTRRPPFELIDNPETILDISDIVMIDPIGTGYSRAEEPQYNAFFHSIEGDIHSFAEFIRLFSIYFGRWNSPKYLLGCSYGTCRACGLAETLMSSCGIYLDGVILLGCALDFNHLIYQRDLAFSNCLLIPSLAATAWYHGRTMQDKTLPEVVDYARRFALEDYAAVMMQPTRLSAVEITAFHQQLSNLVGLPLETVQRCQGRIDEQLFVSEFYGSERKIIGGTDSRYIGDMSSIASEYGEDPSYQDIAPALYPAFMHYMQSELESESMYPKYKAFSGQAFYRWDWSTYDSFTNVPTRPNFFQRLRRSLVANPDLKVFVGSGYYDLRTPLAAAEFSIAHLELPDSYRRNFQCEYYEAGHGFIFDLASLKKFRADLTRFYKKK